MGIHIHIAYESLAKVIILALFAGNSPLSAKMFMVAGDQVVVNKQLPCFTKAVQMIFCSYYLHNIDSCRRFQYACTHCLSVCKHTAFKPGNSSPAHNSVTSVSQGNIIEHNWTWLYVFEDRERFHLSPKGLHQFMLV